MLAHRELERPDISVTCEFLDLEAIHDIAAGIRIT
jgi:hypothetical protein